MYLVPLCEYLFLPLIAGLCIFLIILLTLDELKKFYRKILGKLRDWRSAVTENQFGLMSIFVGLIYAIFWIPTDMIIFLATCTLLATILLPTLIYIGNTNNRLRLVIDHFFRKLAIFAFAIFAVVLLRYLASFYETWLLFEFFFNWFALSSVIYLSFILLEVIVSLSLKKQLEIVLQHLNRLLSDPEKNADKITVICTSILIDFREAVESNNLQKFLLSLFELKKILPAVVLPQHESILHKEKILSPFDDMERIFRQELRRILQLLFIQKEHSKIERFHYTIRELLCELLRKEIGREYNHEERNRLFTFLVGLVYEPMYQLGSGDKDLERLWETDGMLYYHSFSSFNNHYNHYNQIMGESIVDTVIDEGDEETRVEFFDPLIKFILLRILKLLDSTNDDHKYRDKVIGELLHSFRLYQRDGVIYPPATNFTEQQADIMFDISFIVLAKAVSRKNATISKDCSALITHNLEEVAGLHDNTSSAQADDLFDLFKLYFRNLPIPNRTLERFNAQFEFHGDVQNGRWLQMDFRRTFEEAFLALLDQIRDISEFQYEFARNLDGIKEKIHQVYIDATQDEEMVLIRDQLAQNSSLMQVLAERIERDAQRPGEEFYENIRDILLVLRQE